MTSNISSLGLMTLAIMFAWQALAGWEVQADQDQQAPTVSDYFGDDAGQGWNSESGTWKVTEEKVEIYDVDERDIYTSPEEPSWVEWVGLWKEQDGAVKACFAHIAGNPGLVPSYGPWYGPHVLERYNGPKEEWLDFASGMFETQEEALAATPEEAWSAFCKAHNMSEGPEDAMSSTRLEYPTLMTRDGGGHLAESRSQPGAAGIQPPVRARPRRSRHGPWHSPRALPRRPDCQYCKRPRVPARLSAGHPRVSG